MTKRIGNAAVVLDEWEQALASAMGKRVDKVPKGWVTVAERIKKTGQSESTVKRHMQIIGAERRKFNVLRDGRVIPVPHYRLKKK